jgi:hypothetical protein
MRLFITHVEQDYVYAAQLVDELAQGDHGVVAYNPRWPDDYWQAQLNQQDLLLYLHSAFSDQRHVAHTQLEYARLAHKPLVVVKLDDSPLPDSLPYTLLLNADEHNAQALAEVIPHAIRLLTEQQRQQARPIAANRPSTPPNRIRLRWEHNGQHYIQRFGLEYPLIIGRSDECDICIPDKRISRTHASIYLKEQQRYLINLSETNYVYVEQEGQKFTLHYDQEVALTRDAIFRLSHLPFEVYEESEGLAEEAHKTCPVCGRAFDTDVVHCPHDHSLVWYHKIYMLRTSTGRELRAALCESPRPMPSSNPNTPAKDTFTTTRSGVDMRAYPQTDEIALPSGGAAMTQDPYPPSPTWIAEAEQALNQTSRAPNPTSATNLRQYLAQNDETPLSMQAIRPPSPERGIPPSATQATYVPPFDEEITFVETGEPVFELPSPSTTANPARTRPAIQWRNAPDLAGLNQTQWPSACAFMPNSVAANGLYEVLVYLHWADALELVLQEVKKTHRPLATISTPPSVAQPSHLYTLTLELNGARLNQASQQVVWPPLQPGQSYEGASFLFNTPPDLRQTLTGRVVVYRDALLVGQIPLQMTYNPAQSAPLLTQGVHLQALKPLFVCYAGDDLRLAEYLGGQVTEMNDAVLTQIYQLRRQGEWHHSLFDLLHHSQAFQLFWNPTTAQSAYCQREWQAALQIAAEFPAPFLYPTYWEDSLPPPPPELSHLRFQRVWMP